MQHRKSKMFGTAIRTIGPSTIDGDTPFEQGGHDKVSWGPKVKRTIDSPSQVSKGKVKRTERYSAPDNL